MFSMNDVIASDGINSPRLMAQPQIMPHFTASTKEEHNQNSNSTKGPKTIRINTNSSQIHPQKIVNERIFWVKKNTHIT